MTLHIDEYFRALAQTVYAHGVVLHAAAFSVDGLGVVCLTHDCALRVAVMRSARQDGATILGAEGTLCIREPDGSWYVIPQCETRGATIYPAALTRLLFVERGPVGVTPLDSDEASTYCLANSLLYGMRSRATPELMAALMSNTLHLFGEVPAAILRVAMTHQ